MGIEFRFKKTLGSFQLNVEARLPDGIIGIWGPTASGKTTMLNCFAGLMSPEAGYIMVGQRMLFSKEQGKNLPPEQRNIGYVFQEPLLFPHLRVQENICYGAPRGKRAWEEARDILELKHLLPRYPAKLSGGEKQRVALARAICAQPSLLLLDEPLAALDVPTRFRILRYIKEIYQQWKLPMIFVSHSLPEILFLTQYILCLKQGQISGQGPTQDIFLNPALLEETEEMFENIYELPIIQNNPAKGTVILDFGGSPLVVVFRPDFIQPRLRIGIKANDIIVATEKFTGLSARNIIPAVVKKIAFGPNTCRIMAGIYPHDRPSTPSDDRDNNPQGSPSDGGARLLREPLSCYIDITPQAAEELGLRGELPIYLVIKSKSIVIWEGRGRS